MDGSGDRIFRKNFFTYLRRELNSSEKKIIRHCRMVNSRSNVLVQMADMIAGSLNRAENKSKKDRQIYKKIIEHHIEDEWPFK